MKLYRITNSIIWRHEASSLDYSASSYLPVPSNEDDVVYNHFMDFGEGEKAGSFRVELKWEDVEIIIRMFSEKNHPQAMLVQRARRLAAAVDEFSTHTGG
ncbi:MULTISPECIES: hypothetical protein [Roseixanthobacter]|uniref:hypothetical protein n=1 Tax=Roseixanthobacter TaxID=3462307 RepID=UPI00372828CA